MTSNLVGNPSSAPRAHRWLLGDGTLAATRIAITATRTSNSDPFGLTDDAARYADTWDIDVDHSDGLGRTLTTRFAFNYGCYNSSHWVELASVSNERGTLTFDQQNEGRYPSQEKKVLRLVADAVRNQALALTGWTLESGSPMSSMKEKNSQMRATIESAVLQAADPKQCAYVDIGTFLADVLADDRNSLTYRMLAEFERDCDDPKNARDAALLTRYGYLDQADPPDGYTYAQAICALVTAGMPLEPYVADDDPLCVEMDSLLHCACRDSDAEEISALLQAGADPVAPVKRHPDEPPSTPFGMAAQEGLVDVLGLLLGQSCEQAREAMIEILDREYLQLDENARHHTLEAHPGSQATFAFAAARKARNAIRSTAMTTVTITPPTDDDLNGTHSSDADAPDLSMLTVREHHSPEYPPRTRHNAGSADLTAAFAWNFKTPGEHLTYTSANGKYVDIHLSMTPLKAARKLFSAWRHFGGTILNIAGNSIDTLDKNKWSQADANHYVYTSIAKVHEHRPIGLVKTGGQTGMDLAGAVAAVALGIPTEMTLPKGFRQRHLTGEARNQTREQIVDQVRQGVLELRKELSQAPASQRMQP